MLTKLGCSLCDKAVFILRRIKEHERVEVFVENIENKSEYKYYLNKVPVILVNGEEVSVYKVDESLVRQKIEEIKQRDLNP